jgi:catechol 2,3-dioxygenase-like lactoylglutathione lyase family enzyme
MIKGIHVLVYSDDPEADRAFLRDVLDLPYVDAHDGWLIFALPPAELGVHPMETDWRQSVFLMCEDLAATMAVLEARGAEFAGEVSDDEGVGRFASLRLPGGGTLGLYEPAHATPLPGWPTSQPAIS